MRARAEAQPKAVVANEPMRRMLDETELLRGAAPATLERVSARLQLRRFEPGQLVVGHSDTGREVFFVLSGCVRVTLFSASGREVAFRDLGPGEMFGELAAIDGGPRSANVITLERLEIGVLDHASFMEAVHTDPQVADNLLARLARLVRALSERVFEFSLPVAARIVHELLRLCEQADGTGNRVVLSPLPRHADIASRVNTHREAVSRTFAQLQRAGLVVRRPGALIVEDLNRLRDWLAELEAGTD